MVEEIRPTWTIPVATSPSTCNTFHLQLIIYIFFFFTDLLCYKFVVTEEHILINNVDAITMSKYSLDASHAGEVWSKIIGSIQRKADLQESLRVRGGGRGVWDLSEGLRGQDR